MDCKDIKNLIVSSNNAKLLMKKLENTKKDRFGGLKSLWGRVDSNHRTDSRTDLQSVAIATMRLPQRERTVALICGCKNTAFFVSRPNDERFFCICAAQN